MNKQNITIFLVRHGEIDNPNRIIYGRNIDLLLNKQGEKQIINLAKSIKKMEYHPTKIFTSPLSRAVKSAKILASFFSINRKNLRIDNNLIDNSIPVFAGQKLSELEKLYKRGIDEYNEQFIKRGNESKEQIITRMFFALRKIIKENFGETVIIVSHGDPIWLLLFRLVNITSKDIPLSSNYIKSDYLEKGEAWRLIFDKDYSLIDKNLVKGVNK